MDALGLVELGRQEGDTVQRHVELGIPFQFRTSKRLKPLTFAVLCSACVRQVVSKDRLCGTPPKTVHSVVENPAGQSAQYLGSYRLGVGRQNRCPDLCQRELSMTLDAFGVPRDEGPRLRIGAGGGTRTRTAKGLQILSLVCLPFHHARTTLLGLYRASAAAGRPRRLRSLPLRAPHTGFHLPCACRFRQGARPTASRPVPCDQPAWRVRWALHKPAVGP